MVRSRMRTGFIFFVLSVWSAFCACAGIFYCTLANLRWYGIAAGAICMVLAIPFHVGAKRHRTALYVLSVTANSVGSGFSIGTYYSVKEKQLSIENLLTVFALFALLSLCAYFFLSVWKRKTIPVIIAGSVLVALVVGAIVGWIGVRSNFYSLAFFFLLLMSFHYVAYVMTLAEPRDLFRNASFGNFGAFVLITLAVIVVLSEGDFLEIFSDVGGSGKTKKKK